MTNNAVAGELSINERRQLNGLIIAAVFIPTALAFFSDYEKRAFDSYVHMFFADHYRREWFQLWEPRWYGGFFVTSYPPLAHQLVALFSNFFGLEGGFRIVMGSAMVAMVLAVGSVSRTLFDERTSKYAMLAAALFPTAFRFAYVYGQLAMLVAAPFALWAIAWLERFIRTGSLLTLITFTALIGACAGAHHVSTLFAAGGCVLVVLKNLSHGIPDRKTFLRLLIRSALAGACALAAIVTVIWPFWRFAQGEPQTEIPHFSRFPLWERGFGLDVVEQVVLFALAVAAMAGSLARKRMDLFWLASAVMVLVVVSMGDTTPLPRVLFRSQYRWLTYDKFQYWGSLLAAVLIGALIATRVHAMRFLVGLMVVFVPMSMVSVGHKMSDEIQPEYVKDIGPMLQVLKQPEASRYRHLMLGFGDQFTRIDFQVDSPNVDGNYHTARTDPVLRSSGIGTLDSAKYYEGGEATLRSVLSRADDLSLRWAFVTDTWYDPYLLEAGFDLVEVWPSGVSMYEKADVKPLDGKPQPAPSRDAYWWGSVPLISLLIAVVFSMIALRSLRRRDALVGEAQPA